MLTVPVRSKELIVLEESGIAEGIRRIMNDFSRMDSITVAQFQVSIPIRNMR